MIGDVVAGLAAVLLPGGLLLLVWLTTILLAVLAGKGWGRRSAFREVDQSRAVVRRACEKAAVGRAPVPSQRGGGR